jgi:hypothetical protein
LLALLIEQDFVQDALESGKLRKWEDEMSFQLDPMARDRKDPFIQAGKQHGFVLQLGPDPQQKFDESALVVKGIRTPSRNRRKPGMQSQPIRITVQANDWNTPAPKITHHGQTGDVTIEY